MNAHAHVRTPSLTFTTPWQRIMHSAVDACRAAVERMRLAHRRIVGERALAALDDRMLHDLGLHRAEIGSTVAEVLGAAPATRRRAMT